MDNTNNKMSKYVVYKSIDKLPIKLKTKGKVIWDKGIVYGIKKQKQR